MQFIRKGYVARCNNSDILNTSSSGGMFTPIAETVIDRGGVVCACALTQDLNIEHMIIEKKEDIALCRGSKYVQSSMGDCYSKLKAFLENGRYVAFFGTPCQVYGFISFLGKKYDRLFTFDLVCHGTPSPKLWKEYVAFQETKYKGKITNVNFRSKKYGYHVASMTTDFNNNKQSCGSVRTDLMLKAFFSEISSRPSCYMCRFKTIDRCSDITLYDSWHASDIVDGLKDDDRGFTNILVHTQKGMNIMTFLSNNIELYPADYKRAIDLDGSMVCNSALPHPQRNRFYTGLGDTSLDEHIGRFVSTTLMDKIVDNFKRLFYRLGILNHIRNLIKSYHC